MNHHPVTPAEKRRPDDLVVPVDPDGTVKSCQQRDQNQGKAQLDQPLIWFELIHLSVFCILPFYLCI